MASPCFSGYPTWAMGTHKRWCYKESCCIFLRGDMASSSNVFCHQSKNLLLYLVYMQIQPSMSDGMIAYTFLHFMIGWGWEGVWKGQKRRKHWTFAKEDFNFPVWDRAKFRWQVIYLSLVFLHWTYLPLVMPFPTPCVIFMVVDVSRCTLFLILDILHPHVFCFCMWWLHIPHGTKA